MLHSEILCKAGDVDRISLLLASKISNCIWAFKLLDLKTYKKINELKPQLNRVGRPEGGALLSCYIAEPNRKREVSLLAKAH